MYSLYGLFFEKPQKKIEKTSRKNICDNNLKACRSLILFFALDKINLDVNQIKTKILLRIFKFQLEYYIRD